MAEFNFDADRTAAQNIEYFFEYLEETSPLLAPVLRTALKELLPLPEPGLQRNLQRAQANRQILAALHAIRRGASKT